MSTRLSRIGFALLFLSSVLFLPPSTTRALEGSGGAPGGAAGAPNGAAGQEGGTTVFLVRHAEKDTVPEGDPRLTEAGEDRALELAHVLEEAGVTAVFATQFRRTQDTVRPLADHLGLELQIVRADETDRLVEAIRQGPRSSVFVVSGHSNSVPAIIEALGAGAVAPIEEANEFDNLYVVRLSTGGAAEVMTLKFGQRPQ